MDGAFTALGDRLVRRGVVADVFIVGGAAMALAYDATRVTRDVDSLFVPHGIVLDEARNVAQQLGLPMWWLNEQASVYISGKDDPGKRRVFDHPGLRVTAASPRLSFIVARHGYRKVQILGESGHSANRDGKPTDERPSDLERVQVSDCPAER